MFQGTPFLKQVSLAHNNIENIQVTTNFLRLFLIKIVHVSFQTFSFAHLANLHTLDLSHNRIKQLQPSAILGSDFLTVRVQENPFVCSQDGFHVMNGREAISLVGIP
jgi:Leucine-rich repeat (LRR) protein